MNFQIVSPVTKISLIAKNRAIRCYGELVERYGGSRWRKMKGFAKVRLESGDFKYAEIHRYEANGVGRKRIKIKRLLSQKDGHP